MEYKYYCESESRLKDFSLFLFGKLKENLPVSVSNAVTLSSDDWVVLMSGETNIILVYGKNNNVLYTNVNLSNYIEEYDSTLVPSSKGQIFEI